MGRFAQLLRSRSFIVGAAVTLLAVGAIVAQQVGLGQPKPNSVLIAVDPAEEQRAQTNPPSSLLPLIRDEINEMHDWLSVATGDAPPVTEGIRNEDFVDIIEMMSSRCERMGPASVRQAPAFNPETDSGALAALESACNILGDAKRTLGNPRETPDWKLKAKEAQTALSGPVPTPAPAETTKPSPPFEFYPADTRTGIKEVDRIIEAVAKKESETLASLMKFTDVQCTTQTTGMPGEPPCPDGTPDRTPVSVFGSGSCNVVFVTSPTHWRNHYEKWVESQWQLVAAYNADAKRSMFRSAYAVAFADSTGKLWTIYVDSNGSIVQENLGCGEWDLLIDVEKTSFVLAPKRI